MLTTSSRTAEWLLRVTQRPEDFELVYSYMSEVLLEKTAPIGELCFGFGDFLIARYRKANTKVAVEESAVCLSLGAQRLHALALQMLPMLALPVPADAVNEAIRDALFDQAGEWLMEMVRRDDDDDDDDDGIDSSPDT